MKRRRSQANREGFFSDLKVALPALLVFSAVVLVMQWQRGAADEEFGGHPDEAAHYVTGLMVGDYLRAGMNQSPMAYAENYYTHYPKVALGNWPPGFYVVQAGWTSLFGVGTISLMAMMGVLTAFYAVILLIIVRQQASLGWGYLAAVLLICLPLIQQHTAMLMTEIQVGIFALLATWSFARYLTRARWFDAICFGVCAAAAIMTKGSGLALALVPPIAILLSGRIYLLKRLSLWFSAIIVAGLCAPWYYLTADIFRPDGWAQNTPSLNFAIEAIAFYSKEIAGAIGWIPFAFTFFGLLTQFFITRSSGRFKGLNPAMTALLFSVVLLHCIIPAGNEPRHLIPALSAVVYFCVLGIRYVSFLAQSLELPREIAVGIPVVLVLLAFFFQAFQFEIKGYHGFADVAESLHESVPMKSRPLFISSDARGEGMFIAEMAMRDQRPNYMIQRASKALATSTWSGKEYSAVIASAENLLDYLKSERVQYLVVDTSIPEHLRVPHHELVEKAVDAYPDDFKLFGLYPLSREGEEQGNAIRVYSLL